MFFTKGSTNKLILHLYNVLRSAEPIQLQPIIPNLENQRKFDKQILIWFEKLCMFFYIYIYIMYLLKGDRYPGSGLWALVELGYLGWR